MPHIDLNCDLGESFGAYTIGMDEKVIPFITSANVACGFHAGDPLVMQRTVALCKQSGAAVGAHPGFPDLQGFGRRQMKLTNEKVHSHLNTLVNSGLRTYLQDAVVTMRNGRYCIPVKAEYKGQVPGMIHDQSSTGSTLFIEPLAIVKLNNDIRELELQEQKEIEAVLATLSEQTLSLIHISEPTRPY